MNTIKTMAYCVLTTVVFSIGACTEQNGAMATMRSATYDDAAKAATDIKAQLLAKDNFLFKSFSDDELAAWERYVDGLGDYLQAALHTEYDNNQAMYAQNMDKITQYNVFVENMFFSLIDLANKFFSGVRAIKDIYLDNVVACGHPMWVSWSVVATELHRYMDTVKMGCIDVQQQVVEAQDHLPALLSDSMRVINDLAVSFATAEQQVWQDLKWFGDTYK